MNFYFIVEVINFTNLKIMKMLLKMEQKYKKWEWNKKKIKF